MVRNLLKSGAKVVIWNRTPDTVCGIIRGDPALSCMSSMAVERSCPLVCAIFRSPMDALTHGVASASQAGAKELVAEGATVGESPAAVVAACPIVFAMVSDPSAAEALVFSPKGVLEGMGPGKAYVDVSTGADPRLRPYRPGSSSVRSCRIHIAQHSRTPHSAPQAPSAPCAVLSFPSSHDRNRPLHAPSSPPTPRALSPSARAARSISSPSSLFPDASPRPRRSGRCHLPEDWRRHHRQGWALPRGPRQRQQEARHRRATANRTITLHCPATARAPRRGCISERRWV